MIFERQRDRGRDKKEDVDMENWIWLEMGKDCGSESFAYSLGNQNEGNRRNDKNDSILHCDLGFVI
jgi:hypothetical protein